MYIFVYIEPKFIRNVFNTLENCVKLLNLFVLYKWEIINIHDIQLSSSPRIFMIKYTLRNTFQRKLVHFFSVYMFQHTIYIVDISSVYIKTINREMLYNMNERIWKISRPLLRGDKEAIFLVPLIIFTHFLSIFRWIKLIYLSMKKIIALFLNSN